VDDEVLVGNDACIGGRSKYRDDPDTGDCAAGVVVVVVVVEAY
jgi:hypothetical protein